MMSGNRPSRFGRTKKIVAGLLMLYPLFALLNEGYGPIGYRVVMAVVGLPFALLGWWLWRLLPPWRELFPGRTQR